MATGAPTEDGVQLVSDDDDAFPDVHVDRDEFMNSILTSSDKAGDIVEQGLNELAEGRMARPFTNINFSGAADAGEKDFEEAMAMVASEETGVGKELQSILSSATPKKDSKNMDLGVGDLKLVLDFAKEKIETQKQVKPTEDEIDVNAMPPWVIGNDSTKVIRYSPDENLILHYEILELSRFLAPTAAEKAVRERVCSTVESLITTLWPRAKVHLFGSYPTSLYLPSSDIDMCVVGTPEGGDEAERDELAKVMRRVKNFARKVDVVHKTKVPLVKFTALDGNLQCDICFSQMNGVRNVAVVRGYLTTYPSLRPLLLVIKCFLKARGLQETYRGGLGSYALLLMVVSHLQNLQLNFPSVRHDLGSVLIEFFNLYGRLFNFAIVGFAVKDNGKYYNKVQRYDTSPAETLRFSMEDPNDIENEIGPQSFHARGIRRAFMHAHNALSKWRRGNEHHRVSPLSEILNYPDFAGRRSAVVDDMEKKNLVDLEAYLIAHRPRTSTPKSAVRSHRASDGPPDRVPRRSPGGNSDSYGTNKRRKTGNNSSKRYPDYGGDPVFTARFRAPSDTQNDDHAWPQSNRMSKGLRDRLGKRPRQYGSSR